MTDLPTDLKATDFAFHTANKARIPHAVEALIKELGLRSGSSSGPQGSFLTYDFYELLHVYMEDPSARLAIHAEMKESRRRQFEKRS